MYRKLCSECNPLLALGILTQKLVLTLQKGKKNVDYNNCLCLVKNWETNKNASDQVMNQDKLSCSTLSNSSASK